MCGLSLLLELLELLSCDEADGFVPCDQLGSGWHRGQDDVPAQTADTAHAERKQNQNQNQNSLRPIWGFKQKYDEK